MQGKRPQGLLCTHIHKHTRDGVHTKHTHTNVCRYPGDVFAHSEVLKVSQQRGNYKVRGRWGSRGDNTGQYHIVCCRKPVDVPNTSNGWRHVPGAGICQDPDMYYLLSSVIARIHKMLHELFNPQFPCNMAACFFSNRHSSL